MQRIVSSILLVSLGFFCCSFVSSNVPLRHWSYDAIDKLVGHGLIDSAMITTKPISRLEMARLVAEGAANAQDTQVRSQIISAILNRLKEEFQTELTILGASETAPAESFVKPIEDPYIKYVFADRTPDLENQRGDVFRKRSNYRVGFASRMQFFHTAAFYLHPEYTDSSVDPDRDVELIECYGKLALGSLEVEVGEDSLWWGPGYNGSILMSNNTEPFRMIKISNPRPTQLPWIFRGLGLFKGTWFLTELGDDRVIPKTKLTGLRFNFKPDPAFELGVSRTIMFSGSGRPGVGLRDYLDMFRRQEEQAENNQLAGFDVSVLIPVDGIVPAKSMRLYGDFAGEDEAAGLPSHWARLFGMQLYDILQTGRTDLRIEYADNHVPGEADVFYTHGLYQSGYTYKARVIGHHMGTDARDFFIRLTHYLSEDLILGLEFDRQQKDLSSSQRQTTNQFGIDLALFTKDSWQLRTGYRYEDAKNSPEDNNIFHLELVHDF